MDLSRGCVLVARSLDESDIFQNEKWLKVWMWCLIQANHKEKNVPVDTGRSVTVVKVQRGQFIFGRKSAAKKLRLKPSTVWFAMQKLKKLENLDMHVNTHYTLVTIRDYDFYQNMKNYVDRQVDRQLTGNKQPTDTTNTPNTPKKKYIYAEPFERWFKSYPKRNGRRVGKKNASIQFEKISKEEWNDLKTATTNYSLECGEYPKDPERFLKKDFWKDYINPVDTPPQGPKTGKSIEEAMNQESRSTFEKNNEIL